MSCQVVRNTLALTALALSLLVAVPEASADDPVCEGFDRKHRISRLGGRAAFSKTPVTSPADLLKQLQAHRAEIEALMSQHGLGHLTDDLYQAVESGHGLSERDLERGEVFKWMVFRKRSGPTSAGPVCLSAKKTYDAYVVEVTEEEEHPAKAKCALAVSGGVCVGDPFVIDTSGSSEGVKVERKGPGGRAGDAPDAPGSYSFTATAQAQGTKTVTTHTFVIPKICLNLAYGGMTSKEVPGAVDTCTESAKVDVPDCTASVTIAADPTEVRRRQSVQVDVSGTYDSVTVTFKDKDGNAAQALDDSGAAISELSGSGSVSFKKAGTYTLEASASRCDDLPQKCHQTATAEAMVRVKPGWTVRFFGFNMKPESDSIDTATIRPDGVSERTHLKLDDGEGFGAGIEYHFNDRVGLEASVLSADVETEFVLDLDNDWESDEADVSMLAFLVGPNFHLTPGKRVDFYVGLFAGLVDLGDATYRALGETHRRSFDADTTFGAQLGLDIPFGSKGWAVHLGARYMDLTVESAEASPEIAADPLTAEIGFAYRF